jgi:hypothetical protein
MRIRDSTFLLKIDITSLKESPSVITNAYDSFFNKLPITKSVLEKIEQVQVDVCLPNKIILEINSNNNELSQMSLAGIRIEKNKLSDLIAYYSGQIDQPNMEKILELPVQNNLLWNHPGYAIINLFHSDPFAWHLYIGNKIKI